MTFTILTTHELRRTKTQTRRRGSPTGSVAFETLSCTHKKRVEGMVKRRQRMLKEEFWREGERAPQSVAFETLSCVYARKRGDKQQGESRGC